MKLTIEQVEEHLTDLALGVAEGETDAMDAYAFISRVEKAAEPLKKSVKAIAMERALEFGADKAPVQYHGHSFELRRGGSMYSYKHIGSWATAEAEKKRLEELAKAAAKIGAEVPDAETGEMIPPAIVTYKEDSLIVKPA